MSPAKKHFRADGLRLRLAAGRDAGSRSCGTATRRRPTTPRFIDPLAAAFRARQRCVTRSLRENIPHRSPSERYCKWTLASLCSSPTPRTSAASRSGGCCRAVPRADGRAVHLLRPHGPGGLRARPRASTSARIRTSASRRSPISSKARSCTATASASSQRIEPGDVNWMTAGRGIVHSERSPADERPQRPRLHGIQTWVALPRGARSRPSRRSSHHPAGHAAADQSGRVRMRAHRAAVPTAQRAPVKTCSRRRSTLAVEMAAGRDARAAARARASAASTSSRARSRLAGTTRSRRGMLAVLAAGETVAVAPRPRRG